MLSMWGNNFFYFFYIIKINCYMSDAGRYVLWWGSMSTFDVQICNMWLSLMHVTDDCITQGHMWATMDDLSREGIAE